MFGAYELQSAAMEAGVKPILGVEAYVAPGSRFDRESVKTFDGEGNNYHLTLLAESAEGYRNLTHLVSEAYLTGFYYKPRMDWELLEKHHAGLIALSGCLNSEVCQAAPRGRLRRGEADRPEVPRPLRRGPLLHRGDGSRPPGAAADPPGPLPALEGDRHPARRDERRPLPDARGRRRAGRPALHRDGEDAERREADEVLQLRVLREERRRDGGAPSGEWSAEAVTNTAAVAARVQTGVIVDTGLKIPAFPVPEGAGTPEEYVETLAQEGLERRLAPLADDFAARPDEAPPRGVRGAAGLGALRHPEDGALQLLPDRLGLHPVRAGERHPGRTGAGERGGLARRVDAPDHRGGPARLRPPLRALPQPRPDLDARHRRRSLRAPARRGDRVRPAEVRPRERGADHHVQLDEGAGRDPRRRPGPRSAARRGEQALFDDPGQPRQAGDARRGAAERQGAGRRAPRQRGVPEASSTWPSGSRESRATRASTRPASSSPRSRSSSTFPFTGTTTTRSRRSSR